MNISIFVAVVLSLITCCSVTALAENPSHVTDEMFARATSFAKGDLARLESVMYRAQAGETITIGVIGGSITQGSSSSSPENKYANLLLAWWQQRFPNAQFNLVNAGIGATDSYLGVHRVQPDLLDHQPDLVIVEFSVNDSNNAFYHKSYENLVRRILLAPSMPAVVLLFMTQEDGTSAQDQHANIGFRYGLPMVSYRNAILPEIEGGIIRWQDISPDNIHPNDRGHAMVGELLARYFDTIHDNLMDDKKELSVFDRPRIKRQSYENARIENPLTLSPDVSENVVVGNYFDAFPTGWRCNGGNRLTFTVECANIGILYLRTVDGASGAFDVYIDGVPAACLDGDFSKGWGDYAATQEVFSSKEAAFHTIEIRPKDERLVTILGLLLS